MKKLISAIVLALCVFGILPMNAAKPVLRFNSSGEFKILQFTDLHFTYQNPKADAALTCLKTLIAAEKPDFIILTGDVVTGKPAMEGLKTILQPIVDSGIPFSITWGNHDAEQGVPEQELQTAAEAYPTFVGKQTPGISGTSNYALPVMHSVGDSTAAVLWCIDSHQYSKVKGVKGYDYVYPDQIDWYMKTSEAFTKKHGGNPLPSLAFMHIPMPEYQQASSAEGNPLYGTRTEAVCAPEMNSGLFSAMRAKGDVIGVFSGHDHDNDYITQWKGIALAYGRNSAGTTTYRHIPGGNGARIIILKEGKREFNTYIRLTNGFSFYPVNYPTDLKIKMEDYY